MKNKTQEEINVTKRKRRNNFARFREMYLTEKQRQANKEYETNPDFRAAVDQITAAIIERYDKGVVIELL